MNRRVFAGVSASAGVALGLAYRTDRVVEHLRLRRSTGDPVRDITEAFDAVAERLRALAASLRAGDHVEQADIMDAAGLIAADPDLRGAAIGQAREGTPAAVAVTRAVNTYAAMLAGLDSPMLAERATDVRQVGRRVVAWLNGAAETDVDLDGPLVLLAHEIGAADLLEPHAPVAAAVSVTGGPNSHAAIVARSLGIPFLLGVDRDALDCPDGAEILVDTRRSTVIVHPAPRQRQDALSTMDAARARRAAAVASRDLPCETLDGTVMVLRANVATPADVQAAHEARSEGVGLLRTELPFLDVTAWPSFRQHIAALEPVFRRLEGKPVTVRTLDFADDKLPPFLAAERGARFGPGLPVMLAHPEALIDQFRAILTAGVDADIRIMIPMVASGDDLRACARLLAEAGDRPVPLGAMIELPEAVADIDDIAATAAFLSIGSNDLTCQLLGLDRRHPEATPAMAAHPVVLRAIRDTVAAAHRHGRVVSVCGDAAADPHVIPLLIGLGCDVLSVAPAALDDVRSRVRRLKDSACRVVATRALELSSASAVWQLVERESFPD